MGEKIRDINTIKIGSCEFMIELNEGYFNEGRVIHVQNNKFRYLFQEKQFYKLCANFMRSKSELDYLRTHRTERQSFMGNNGCDTVNSGNTIEQLQSFLDYLEEKNIDYRVIECKKKFATIIVSPDMYYSFEAIIKKNKLPLKILNHPFGSMFGYLFLYQMNEFKLLMYKEIYIQVFFQLPCMSLEKNTWIPLDRIIQRRVWNCDGSDVFSHMIDTESLFVYEICLCIFQFRDFSEGQVRLLSKLYSQSDKRILRVLLSSVFFSYTDILLSYLNSNSYSEIINSYFSYNEY